VSRMRAPRVLINALSMSQGGGRSYVTNLLHEFGRDDRGFRVTLLASPEQLEGIETHGVEIAWVRLPARQRVIWRVAYEELWMPLRARSFDLLFCVADLAPRFAAAPTLVLLRNLNIYDRRWYDDARTRTLERLVRWGLPNARRVLFPSQAAADLIGERVPVPAERLRVVPYGISLDAFERAEDAESPAERYLFLAAAVERHKNIEVLVECLPHLRDDKVQVWIAGHSLLDPAHRKTLERRAEVLGVRDRLRFLGAVPYRDVLRYHRGAVAFVFPSYIETFGHPLLEAMVVGTPIVASDIPTFREVAGEAGLFFPPDDAHALARLVDRVQAETEATARRVEIGRARAREFSWSRSVDALCGVFEEVLRETGGPLPRLQGGEHRP